MIRKILKYSFADLTRSRWSYLYLAFYLTLGFSLLFLNDDLPKAIITLMNIILILTPMIGTIFGIMYFYDSKEFVELLLAQPIKRTSIFIGQYLGVTSSLALSLTIGLGIPFIAYGILRSPQIWHFTTLIIAGTLLTFIFVAIAINIGLRNNNKIKGFGYAILAWLSLAVIYDGIFLISLILLNEYPLDKFTLIATFTNPIDLARIMILTQLDISALLGHTGALFQKFFHSTWSTTLPITTLCLWIILPLWNLTRLTKNKDF